jgi:undecaprenyl-diphosphatase
MQVLTVAPHQILAAFPSFAIDGQLSAWFRDRLGSTSAMVFGALSLPGCAVWTTLLVTTLALGMAYKRRWYPCLLLMLAVPFGAVLSEALKMIVQRPRPFRDGPFGPWGGYSFPSGHTMAATLVYGCLAILLMPVAKNLLLRIFLLLMTVSIILSVALSRVALGAHYLSDVVAAMILGTIWLTVCACSVGMVRRTRSPVPVEIFPAEILPVEIASDDTPVNLPHNDAA